jgi:PadR family transcriptional regulator, regulatory protein PadR
MFLWLSQRNMTTPADGKLDLLPGTLDLLVLRTLHAMGTMHGYGIARRIEQVGGEGVLLNEGTVYASLVRLQQSELISAAWGVSENGRKARFYSITRRGTKPLAEAKRTWERTVSMVSRILKAGS